MTLQIDSHKRPRRAGHQKSRNGCLTCKYDHPDDRLTPRLTGDRIRRIKCDETRPHCRRCTESGRKCEGPGAHQFHFFRGRSATRSRSSTPIPQLEVSLLAPQHSEYERHAFHYYRQRVVPHFATAALDAGFWEDLVPRLAQTYDFVWDAVVCISSLHEHVPYTSLTTKFGSTGLQEVTNRAHQQTLKVYNRAIAGVRELVERHELDDSVVVLSCILFSSVEFQQRNVKTGNDLVKRCCRILTENLTSLQTRPNSLASHDVHQVVAPFVLRRAVLIATLGDALPPQQVVAGDAAGSMSEAVRSRHTMINEARVQFHSLVNHCYDVIRLAEFVPHFKDGNPVKTWFSSRRQSLLDDLTQWKASFTAASSSWTPHVETDWIRSYMLMYWDVCFTSLAACDSPRETIFDDYMDQFADIIERATLYLQHSAQQQPPPHSGGPGPGIIPPLYFCATKCRDPTLRRAALRLMQLAPRQEDLWAFLAPERVVAKVISVEEGDDPLFYSSRGTRSEMLQPQCAGLLPPEERRFAHVSVVSRQVTGSLKQRQALKLSRFESATDGSNRLIDDYTWLDDGEEAYSTDRHCST